MLSLDNICPSTRVDKRYFKLFPRYNHFCYVLKIEILEKLLVFHRMFWKEKIFKSESYNQLYIVGKVL